MKRDGRGFTVVELLIVIVVIGILAAITVVAYNGIQQRAKNSQRIVAAKQWVEGIKAYLAQNGKYPAIMGTYCIGETNITDLDANPDVDCGTSSNVKHSATYTTTFNDGIKTISTLPQFPGEKVKLLNTNIWGSGMLFRANDTYDPSGENIVNYPTLIFFLDGTDQDCVLKPLATSGEGGNFTQTTAKNSGSYPTGTVCRVMLPDPAKL